MITKDEHEQTVNKILWYKDNIDSFPVSDERKEYMRRTIKHWEEQCESLEYIKEKIGSAISKIDVIQEKLWGDDEPLVGEE